MSVNVKHTTNGPMSGLSGATLWEGNSAHTLTGFKPDALAAFTDQTGVAIGTLTTSDAKTLATSNDSGAAADRVFALCVRPGGSYTAQLELNGDGIWADSRNAISGDTVKLRLTSDSAASTARTATLYADGRSTTWTVTTATVTVYADDTFTASDGSSLTSHSMNTGSGWVAGRGTWQIWSNAALCVTSAGDDQNVVYTECGAADVVIDRKSVV